MKIPFNRPFLAGNEMKYIRNAFDNNCSYSLKCQELLENKLNAKKVLLTTSCTSALEMSALLLDIKKEDEIIMPSFTFVSTANAFVLRGAKPVFADIRKDTLNLDERLFSEKITKKTKAIVPMHYGGIGCEMDYIMDIAKKHNLPGVEDAAQAVNAFYKGKALGTIGDLGCYSFHKTKNYTCNEGGAIVINNPKHIERAEIIMEKGTDRNKFLKGEIDKYTWVDVGSSYVPSEILAAFLYAQLEKMDFIHGKRKKIFDFYDENLKELEDKGDIRLPSIPKECKTNYHLFYMLLENREKRDGLMNYLKEKQIQATFHYIPLHLSKMGKSFRYRKGDFPVSEEYSERILRLPFYTNLEPKTQERIAKETKRFFKK